jgi:hypothetical protein
LKVFLEQILVKATTHDRQRSEPTAHEQRQRARWSAPTKRAMRASPPVARRLPALVARCKVDPCDAC